MHLLAASEILPDAAPGEPHAPAVVEIGPYDLPEPPGGYVDLVLDEVDPGAPAGAPAPPPEAIASSAAASSPRPSPALHGGEGGVARSTTPQAPIAREHGGGDAVRGRAAQRWFLFPEAFVVTGFLVFGATFAGAVHLLRRPAVQAAPVAPAAAAPSAANATATGPVRRRRDGRVPQTAPPAAPAPSEEEEPIPAEAPIDPEAPPAPNLAPWSGAR